MSEEGGQEIAYGDALEESPTWVSLDRDLGIRVAGWSIRRGRVDETQRTGTGTATINVHDLSGFLGSGSDFPTHARLSLRGSPRFRGHVDEVNVEVHHDVPLQPGAPLGLSDASIQCVDLFDYLSTAEVVPGQDGDLPTPKGMEQYVVYNADQVDDVMSQVLTDVGVPGGLLNLFSGNVLVQRTQWQSGTTAMQILDEMCDAEWPGVSNRFINSTGQYSFRGRFARFDPTNPSYGIQFWEAGTGSQVTTGRAQIRRLSFSTQKKLIVNSAMAYPNGAAELEVPQYLIEDTGSIGQWGRRSWSAENLLTKRHLSNGNTGADEAVLFATYQTANYADPVPRINRVQFRSLRDEDERAAAIWDLMCNAEIGDVLDIYTDWISGRYFIEGLSLEVTELDGTIPMAVMDLDLSPAAYWTVDPF